MEETIILYPHPGRGHLLSMLELGKSIAKHNPSIQINIIILNTPNMQPPSSIFSGDNFPSIKFIHLPPVTPSPVTKGDHLAASFYELPNLNNSNLRQALISLSKTYIPKAFVADFFCSVAVGVSTSLNIPSYFFYTSSASGLCHFLYWPTIDDDDKEIKKPSDLDEILSGVQGTTTLSSRDIPGFMSDPSLKVYRDFIDTGKEMAKSAGIIVNTFEFLEADAVKALEEGKCCPYQVPPPRIYCVGPLLFNEENKTKHECVTWLDSQPSRSVVFLCFGSMGVFSASQLKEMATALEKSRVRFLWVVRNPSEEGENQVIKNAVMASPKEPNLEILLPEGFLDRTKGRGFVVKNWAPQSSVLNHGSVGGFVTHCGWNSILESICAGVPMIAWPLYAEQKMNKMFLVKDMKLALPLNMESEEGLVNAEDLEKRLVELMESEKGLAIRNRVLGMREAAMEALSDKGSSILALDRFFGGLKCE